ncbi:MAG: hypothetical protein RMK29_10945 [Myxococcales bacterium]|nr:hypothetical protein [Myxococcota bacterium]MDW8282222.1 hypothetical protein [Myxococcales bacterium]
MHSRSVLFPLLGLLLGLPPGPEGTVAWARKRAGEPPPREATEQTTRAVSELSGKFKWGMSPAECMDIIEKDIRARFEPRIRAESDPFKQDVIRREMMDAIAQMRSSYIKFDGQHTGWDVSIVDREFGHKNDESMLVIWEANQRRFLFFWRDKLYKQYLALPAERFKGKTFEEFAEIMQERYGKAQINFAKMQTQDEMALDYLEWPPAGEYVLRAYDQSNFYGNFSLALLHKSVYPVVERERAIKSPPRGHRITTSVIDIVAREDTPGDPNADIVDEVLGRQTLRTNQGAPLPSGTTGKTGGKKEAR